MAEQSLITCRVTVAITLAVGALSKTVSMQLESAEPVSEEQLNALVQKVRDELNQEN